MEPPISASMSLLALGDLAYSESARHWSFQESGALIQTPNSRDLVIRTPTNRTSQFTETATLLLNRKPSVVVGFG